MADFVFNIAHSAAAHLPDLAQIETGFLAAGFLTAGFVAVVFLTAGFFAVAVLAARDLTAA